MKTLVMMVGLPRSGKTTEARKQQAPIVSPDAIRLSLHGERFLPAAERQVWTFAHYMVTALFLAGHDAVVLDAANTTRARRDEWKSAAWVRRFIELQCPVETCIARALAADEVIVPVIERMAEYFEPVASSEQATSDELGGAAPSLRLVSTNA